jgi:hypothetical protein
MKVSFVATVALALLSVPSCAHSDGAAGGPAQKSMNEGAAWPDDSEDDKIPARDCTPATTESAPADGRIVPSAAALVTYPVDGSPAPTASVKNGTLHVSANLPVKPEAQYAGVVLAFPKCTDATAFAGVRFKIRGNYAGCSMEFAAKDVQHEDRAHRTKFATGRRGDYPPQTRLEPSQVTQVVQTVTVPFGGQNIRGNPALPLEKSKITGLVWQFSVGMASNIVDGTTACVADLDIGDITFYR